MAEKVADTRADTNESLNSSLNQLALTGVALHSKGEIGRGAYGRVYTVKYRGVVYAAKEIHALLLEMAGAEEARILRNNFIRECSQSSKLNHDNVVPLIGIYYPKKQSFPVMVMELMDESLTSYAAQPDVSLKNKLSILHDVAEGLSYLHNNQVVHRDLSPNNVLIKYKGVDQVLPDAPVAKIADLGVAKIIRADSKRTQTPHTKFPGTADFMPPEAFEDNPHYNTSLDVFSYGGVMLYTVNGKWPTPTAQVERNPYTNELRALSEVERRQQYLDKVTGQEVELLKPLIKDCLNNNPTMRPSIFDLSNKIMPLKETVHDSGMVIKPVNHGIPADKYCLVTLESDQSTKNPSVYHLKPSTKIGQPHAKEPQDIELEGTEIQQEHCIVEVIDAEVFITPLPDACNYTLVKGTTIQERTKLYHGCQIQLAPASSAENEYSQNIDGLKKKMEDSDCQCLTDAFHKAKRLIKEADILVNQKMKNDMEFKVVMQVPAHLLSPVAMDANSCYQIAGDEIAISVMQKAQRVESIWDIESFEAKIIALGEEIQNSENLSIGTSSLLHVKQPPLIGVANIFMQCLLYYVCHEYDAPLIGPTGKVCGTLKLSLERIQATPEEIIQDIGSQIKVKITVTEATGLPFVNCHGIFVRYKFWGQPESKFAPLQASLSPVQSEKLLEELKFDHAQIVEVRVTKDFLDYIKYGTLSVELYGHHSTILTTSDSTDIDSLQKSFPDRCYKVKKNLEMWIKITENNNYVPVVYEQGKNIGAGGVYELQEGHQLHNIEVKVSPVEESGDGPLECSHITSIAIGSISYNEESLDSYQEDDLDRLRTKWSSALMFHIQYAKNEMNKLLKMKGLINEEGETLTKQWVASNMEHFLLSSSCDGIPGVQSNRKMPPGMEQCIITLYLDLNDDMLTPCNDEDPAAAVATAPLKGEDNNSMMRLTLLKNDSTAPEATASWDLSIHNNPYLKYTTHAGVRVHAILKVSVMLKHPPNIELVLRKRISLRIVKKGGFVSSIKNRLSTAPTQTGVMYEVVTGKPKLEGMLHPSNHPSFIELEENDDVVEKYIEAIMSVCTILTDDQSKQEVSLKEKLTGNGKSTSPSLTDTADPVTTQKHKKSPTVQRSSSLKSLSPHERLKNVCVRSSSLEMLPQPKKKNEGSSLLNKQSPFLKGQRVIVDTMSGKKSGEIKFIGSTEFAKGKWIGIALDEPTGKHNGTKDGKTYFICKDKHGLFVRQDKIKSQNKPWL